MAHPKFDDTRNPNGTLATPLGIQIGSLSAKQRDEDFKRITQYFLKDLSKLLSKNDRSYLNQMAPGLNLTKAGAEHVFSRQVLNELVASNNIDMNKMVKKLEDALQSLKSSNSSDISGMQDLSNSLIVAVREFTNLKDISGSGISVKDIKEEISSLPDKISKGIVDAGGQLTISNPANLMTINKKAVNRLQRQQIANNQLIAEMEKVISDKGYTPLGKSKQAWEHSKSAVKEAMKSASRKGKVYDPYNTEILKNGKSYNHADTLTGILWDELRTAYNNPREAVRRNFTKSKQRTAANLVDQMTGGAWTEEKKRLDKQKKQANSFSAQAQRSQQNQDRKSFLTDLLDGIKKIVGRNPLLDALKWAALMIGKNHPILAAIALTLPAMIASISTLKGILSFIKGGAKLLGGLAIGGAGLGAGLFARNYSQKRALVGTINNIKKIPIVGNFLTSGFRSGALGAGKIASAGKFLGTPIGKGVMQTSKFRGRWLPALGAAISVADGIGSLANARKLERQGDFEGAHDKRVQGGTTLGGTAIGAIAGAIFGGPAGAMIGASIGGLAGDLIGKVITSKFAKTLGEGTMKMMGVIGEFSEQFSKQHPILNALLNVLLPFKLPLDWIGKWCRNKLGNKESGGEGDVGTGHPVQDALNSLKTRKTSKEAQQLTNLKTMSKVIESFGLEYGDVEGLKNKYKEFKKNGVKAGFDEKDIKAYEKYWKEMQKSGLNLSNASSRKYLWEKHLKDLQSNLYGKNGVDISAMQNAWANLGTHKYTDRWISYGNGQRGHLFSKDGKDMQRGAFQGMMYSNYTEAVNFAKKNGSIRSYLEKTGGNYGAYERIGGNGFSTSGIKNDAPWLRSGSNAIIEEMIRREPALANMIVSAGLGTENKVHGANSAHYLGTTFDISGGNSSSQRAALKRLMEQGLVNRIIEEDGGVTHVELALEAYGKQLAKSTNANKAVSDVATSTEAKAEVATQTSTSRQLADNGIDKALMDRMMGAGMSSKTDKVRNLVFSATDVTGSLGCWGVVHMNNYGGMAT